MFPRMPARPRHTGAGRRGCCKRTAGTSMNKTEGGRQGGSAGQWSEVQQLVLGKHQDNFRHFSWPYVGVNSTLGDFITLS